MKLILEQRCLFDGSVVATTTVAAGSAGHQASTNSATSAIHEIVFVDPRVANWQQLVSGIRSDAEVVVLDTTRDALQQITSALAGQTGITAIDILSHGSSGQIDVGSTPITAATLTANAAEVASWSSHLAAGADILIYGCDVGSGPTGQALITDLHNLTGAEVAASTTPIGQTAGGENWALDTSTGAITATDPFSQTAEQSYDGQLSLGTPAVSISSSATVAKPGTTITETVSFRNSSGDTGYNGFVDLFVPTALKNDVTVTGSGISQLTTTLASGAGGTLTYTEPLTGGTVTLSAAQASALGVAAGDEVISVLNSVGTWTTATPSQSFTVSIAVPNTAADVAPMLGNTYYIGAIGGFEYADNSGGTDGWQLGTQHNATTGGAIDLTGETLTSAAVGVKMLDVSITANTVYGEGETATGPDYPVTYVVDLNPADVVSSSATISGASAAGIDVTITLPNTVIYTGASETLSTGGTMTANYSGGTTWNGQGNYGGTITLHLSSLTGEVKEAITVYVPKYDSTGNEILSSSGSSTIGVSSGATAGIAALSTATVSGSGSTDLYWNYGGGYDLSSTTNAIQSNTTNTAFTARAVAVQEGTYNYSVTPAQADAISLVTKIEVSDYYDFSNATLTSVLSDGLAYQSGTSSYSFSGGTNAPSGGTSTSASNLAFTVEFNGSTGDTTLIYSLGSLAAGTYGSVTYKATVDGAYLVQHSLVELKENDTLKIANGSDNSALGLGNATSDAPTGNADYSSVAGAVSAADSVGLSGVAVIDDTSATASVPKGSMTLTIVAVDGVAVSTSSTPQITPGDTVTYEMTYSLVSGSYNNMILTTYLPLPIFVSTDPNQTGTSSSFVLDNSGTVTTTYNNTSGEAALVGVGNLAAATLAGTPNVPTINSVTVSSSANSVSFNLGSLQDISNTGGLIDIKFTVTASSQPFVNGLFLTATGQTTNDNTTAVASTAQTTKQVELISPDLSIKKGITSVTSSDGADQTTGNIYTFDSNGNSESSATVDSTFAPAGQTLSGSLTDIFTSGTTVNTASAINGLMDLNARTNGSSGITAGSTVRIVDTVLNSGSAVAYNVGLSDNLPVSGELASSGYNSSGVGKFEIVRGDGTVLVSASNYSAATDSSGHSFSSFSDLVAAFFSSNGIRITNSGNAVLSSVSSGTGANTLYVVYDLTLSSSLTTANTILDGGSSSKATLTSWTNGSNGSWNYALNSSYPQTWQTSGKTPSDLGQTSDGAVLLSTVSYSGELQIVASSQAGTEATALTTTSDPLTDATIGDIVRYRAYVELPSGTTSGLSLTVTLPNGLVYEGGPTAEIVLVGDNNTSHVTSSSGLTIAAGSSPDVDPTTALTPNTSSGSPVFSLGNITNNSSSGTVYAVVEFDAVVSNAASSSGVAAAKSGSTLDATLTLNDSGAYTTTAATFGSQGTARVDVVEPTVAVDKVVSAINETTDAVTYTVVLTNTSNSTAYGISLSDVLPATGGVVTGTTGTWTGSPSITDTNGPRLSGSLTSLASGQSASVTYTVALSGATAATTATATWDSLPTQSLGSVTGGAAGSATGARDGDGSGHNTYSSTASIGVASVSGKVWGNPSSSATDAMGASYNAGTDEALSGVTVSGSETYGLASGGSAGFSASVSTTGAGNYTLLLPSTETKTVASGSSSSSGTVAVSVSSNVTNSSGDWQLRYDAVDASLHNSVSETLTAGSSGPAIGFAYKSAPVVPVLPAQPQDPTTPTTPTPTPEQPTTPLVPPTTDNRQPVSLPISNPDAFGSDAAISADGIQSGEYRAEHLELMLVGSVGNRFVISEQPATIEVPPNIFRSTVPNDNLTYEALRPDGSPLPKWLSFDARNLTFRGVPPDAARGAVDIVIVAKNTNGSKAEAQFKILVGRDSDDQAPVQQGVRQKNAANTPSQPHERHNVQKAPAPDKHAALDGIPFASLTQGGGGAIGRSSFTAQLQQAANFGPQGTVKALIETLVTSAA